MGRVVALKYKSVSLDVVEARAEVADAVQFAIHFDGPRSGYIYLIKRVTIWAANDVPEPSFTLFVGLPQTAFTLEQAAKSVVDHTDSGGQDVADENQPVAVSGGQRISGYWFGATVGAVHAIRLQYDIVQTVPDDDDRAHTAKQLSDIHDAIQAQTASLGKRLEVIEAQYPNQHV